MERGQQDFYNSHCNSSASHITPHPALYHQRYVHLGSDINPPYIKTVQPFARFTLYKVKHFQFFFICCSGNLYMEN